MIGHYRAKRQHRLLDRKAFEAICDAEGGISSTKLLLLDYLDANGTIFYRPELFSDIVL